MNIPSNAFIEEIHISRVTKGDTIMCNDGHVRTISLKDIHKGGFCGSTIFGESYNSGTIPVKRVRFRVPTNNGMVIR